VSSKPFLRVFKILPLLILLLLVGSVRGADDAVSAGTDAASRVRDSWATEEGFRNITKALTTGEVPVKTLDGSKEGIAHINCPGSQALFEILIQPGSTGDLNFISVAYDVDLDGRYDKRYEVPGPVSGICANGFVKCQAGTWQDCHWYAWKFENGELSTEEVVPSDLGGCYCINTGCTQAGFFTFKDQVLRSLGGGVAGAMAAADPRLSVSEAEIEDTAIRYYAQNAGDCSLTQGSFSTYGFETPEDLYGNSALLSTKTEEEVLSQSADPDSFYNLLTGSPAFTHGERLTCQKVRTVYVSDCKLTEDITDSCSALENRSDCRLEEEKVYDVNGLSVTTYRNFNPTGVMPVDSCVSFNPADFANCISDCTGDVTTDGGCRICYTNYVSGVQYLGNDLWKVDLRPNGSNSCGDIFDYRICGRFEGSWSIADDPCVSVVIDGTNVISPFCYHSDGGTPSSGTFSGNSGTNVGHLVVSLNNLGACNGWASGTLTVYMKLNIPEAVCRDWWKIKRTYVCTSSGSSVSPDVSRAETVSETLTEGTGFTYNDPDYGTQRVDISPAQGTNCIPACKLRKVEDTAQATATSTTADYRNDSSTQVFIYRTCVDGKCPVKPGETIVEDCKCLEEFNLTYGAMESLRQAAVDMICSDGTKK